MLRCPYKDYSSLNRWQANRDLLSVFTFYNYLFVMTHRQKGKKASIISRRGLLEDSPYRVVGLRVCHATGHDRTPRAWRPRGVLWSLPQYVNTFS
jgi:hypothetical protein